MKPQEFLNLNEGIAVRRLLDQILAVERVWDKVILRQESLDLFFELLDISALHKSSLLQKISSLKSRVPADPSYHQFMTIFVPIERAYGRMVNDSDILIDDIDHSAQVLSKQKIPAYLILENIRSAFNVGSIIRLADCVGIEKIYFCGYTALPDREKVTKAALGAESNVQWEWIPHAMDCIRAIQQQGVSVYALETVQGAVEIEKFSFPLSPVAILCGNERYGLEASLLKQTTGIIEIPCWGFKNSLNVAVSVGIASF